MDFKGKEILLIGYGRSGKGCEKFLKKRSSNVFIYDDYLAEYDTSIVDRQYDFAIISPGVSLNHKVVRTVSARGIPVISETDLAYLNCKSKRIVAVSGTNGKTTVCTILYDMLSRTERTHLVGNIGLPFIEEVEKIRRDDVIVIEMSSFQIEQSRYFTPMIAALTNIGEDHLDRHSSKEEYIHIKRSLADKAGIVVLNADDPNQTGYPNGITYSMEKGSADYRIQGRDIVTKRGRISLPQRSRGYAYDLDYLCAYTVASTLKGERREFLKSYSSVILPHFRNEYVGELCGAKVYNDSKGTNIDATLFAVSRIKEDLALILGGSDKGESYSRLFDGLPENVRKIYLVGANAGDMYRAASSSERERCLLCADLETCIADFVKAPLRTLLFSPASASFDHYSDYLERGEKFNEIIKRYGATLVK